MMRIRGRSAVVLTVIAAAALAVGFFAFAASAAADPPACNPGTSPTDNKSCLNFQVLPNHQAASNSLFVHTHTNYAHPGDKSMGGFAKTVTLLFDSDFAITPGTIPTCTTAQLSGKNISQAWATCGPGAAAAHNAYLSPASAVSGRASTAPSTNFNGCTLVFRGPNSGSNSTVILYTRVTLVTNGIANCATPATNTSGNTTVLLQGTIAPAGVAGFGKKLAIPGVDALPLPLDDFTSILKRGNYFKAKCSATPWKVRGTFAYSGTGQAADVSNPTQTCQVGQSGGPPTTKITKAKIKKKRKKATFKFTAGGQARGFECQLTRKHHKAPDFKGCHSPKVYKHLKRGKYTFKVRAVGPGGTDATPAKKSFKIKKHRHR
jgi:hypothetical protein